MDAKTDKIELTGSKVIAAIKDSGVEFVLAVPDIHTSKGLLFPIAADPKLRLVRVCKEDECVGIASGLSYCDKRALILIQYTGFLDSLNAIRGVAVEYKQPICMMVGLLGHEPEKEPSKSGHYGVRIIEPICDAMGIQHLTISQDADVARIKPAIDKAYKEFLTRCDADWPETRRIMMKREEAFNILARHIKDDDILIATYSSAAEWNELHPRVMNYLSVGAMGLASSHGLGLALGRPDKRVIILDGDGSLLMNLGSLVSIAAQAPRNLVHFVSQNNCYEANGGHQIPNKDVDFAGLAKSAGYAHTYDFSDIRAFEQQVGHVLGLPGPVFGTLRVERTRQLTYDYPGLYSPEKRRALKAELQKTAPR